MVLLRLCFHEYSLKHFLSQHHGCGSLNTLTSESQIVYYTNEKNKEDQHTWIKNDSEHKKGERKPKSKIEGKIGYSGRASIC